MNVPLSLSAIVTKDVCGERIVWRPPSDPYGLHSKWTPQTNRQKTRFDQVPFSICPCIFLTQTFCTFLVTIHQSTTLFNYWEAVGAGSSTFHAEAGASRTVLNGAMAESS